MAKHRQTREKDGQTGIPCSEKILRMRDSEASGSLGGFGPQSSNIRCQSQQNQLAGSKQSRMLLLASTLDGHDPAPRPRYDQFKDMASQILVHRTCGQKMIRWGHRAEP